MRANKGIFKKKMGGRSKEGKKGGRKKERRRKRKEGRKDEGNRENYIQGK